MALNQCRGYFRGHPGIRLVNDTDTALVARQIAEHRWDRIGCVASMRAMELYGLECLAEDIADDPSNLTRFMVLTPHRHEALPEAGDLATITLILPHKRGSLNGALSCLMDHGISLSKVESMVIPGRPYEYEFVMDLEAPETERLHAGIAALRGHADRLVTLGLYGRDRTCDT
jgi:prephenate dehydratase